MKKYIRVLMAVFFVAIISKQVQAQASFKVPVYEKFKLKNGLTIYLMEQHEVPIINVSAVLPAGAIYDQEKNGLSALTADALKYGTKSFTKSQIDEQLDFLGASISTYASKESAGLAAQFAAKDQDKVLPIIKEVLIDPVFNEEEFIKEKSRTLQALERAKESPRSVIGNYWDKFIYGDHPYGNPVSGKVSTVNNLNISDVKDFYKRNYGPSGSAIAIVGDFNTKAMKAKIIKLMDNWEVNNAAAQTIASVNIPTGSRVLLVNKEDARETTMLIGGKGVSRNNPDYVAIQVVNTVLGGRFTSYLNDELRVNSGLTYGANSRFSPLKNSGTFYISTFTANKSTQPTIEKALEVLHKFNEKGLDQEILTSAKNYVKGQFPPDYETSSQLASLLTQMFWYDFNENYINNFEANVDELTVAKTKEIIQKYFSDKDLHFLFVGKKEEIKDIVSKYGKLTEKQINEDGY